MLEAYDGSKLLNVMFTYLHSSGEHKLVYPKNQKYSVYNTYSCKSEWFCTRCSTKLPISDVLENILEMVGFSNKAMIPYGTGRIIICNNCNDILYIFGEYGYIRIKNDYDMKLIKKCKVLDTLYLKQKEDQNESK